MQIAADVIRHAIADEMMQIEKIQIEKETVMPVLHDARFIGVNIISLIETGYNDRIHRLQAAIREMQENLEGVTAK